MAGATFPIPEGVTASFSNVAANVNTADFSLDAGLTVVTFQAIDPNNCGTVILYDDSSNVILTMTAPGHWAFMVPVGGLTYYFNASAGAQLLAGTTPNSLR